MPTLVVGVLAVSLGAMPTLVVGMLAVSLRSLGKHGTRLGRHGTRLCVLGCLHIDSF